MKRRKIAVLIAILITGNYFVPFNIGNIAYAKQLTTIKANEINNNLKKMNIMFYNIWGGQSVQLKFDTESMKIDAIQHSGDLGNGNNIYMKLFYYNSKTKQTEINQAVKDGNSMNLINLLNGKKFNFGDVIGIEYEENGNNPTVENRNTIKNDGKMHYFKITQNGLISETPNIIINPFAVLTGEKVTAGHITGNAEPNTKIEVEIDGNTFIGKSSNDGKFSIKVEDNNGFSEKTKIKVTAISNVGSIEQNITPVLSKDIELQNSFIQIINGWGTPAGLIKFNPETMTFNISQYNAYLGQNSNSFLKITVSNPTTGKMEENINLNGNDNTTILSKILNNKKFNYGDIIGIHYDNTQGKIIVNNIESSNTTEYYQITKNGLKIFNQKLMVQPFEVLNGSKVTQGYLKGIAPAGSQVQIKINNETFDGLADSNGKFHIFY